MKHDPHKAPYVQKTKNQTKPANKQKKTSVLREFTLSYRRNLSHIEHNITKGIIQKVHMNY